MAARTVSELRAALSDADDLLVGLPRVAGATRTVLEVDGAGLTLVHEDGLPRWVAATDRVWVEQAKGVLAATQGTDPEAAFPVTASPMSRPGRRRTRSDGRPPGPTSGRRQDIPPSYGVKPACLVVPRTGVQQPEPGPSAGNLRIAGGVGVA